MNVVVDVLSYLLSGNGWEFIGYISVSDGIFKGVNSIPLFIDNPPIGWGDDTVTDDHSPWVVLVKVSDDVSRYKLFESRDNAQHFAENLILSNITIDKWDDDWCLQN